MISLGLYALQQLGMALGVGGETVLLFSGAAPATAGAARRVTRLSLFLIIVSGIFITLAHIVAGEGATVAEPAYLFKWILVIGIAIAGFTARGSLGTILVGGSWYALFFLHTLAPVAPFFGLIILYAGWMALFALVFLLFNFRSGAPKPSSVPLPEEPSEAPPSPPPPPPEPRPAPPRREPAFPPPAPASMRATFPPPSAPKPAFAWEKSSVPTRSLAPAPASTKASQGTAPPLSFVALAEKEPPPRQTPLAARPGLTVAPPPNLPGVPMPKKDDGISPIALQSIPTVLPEKDPKPLSGVMVMPRNPNDLKK